MSREQPQRDQKREDDEDEEDREKGRSTPLSGEQQRDPIEESSEESFPASDPPSWIPEHT